MLPIIPTVENKSELSFVFLQLVVHILHQKKFSYELEKFPFTFPALHFVQDS